MTKKNASKGTIDPADLHSLMSDPHVKILDGTFVMPGSNEDPVQKWQQQRIGNAQFFDVNKVADPNTTLPHMLPTPQDFETAVSELGISNDDLIIVYGQSGMAMGSARVWWMFRVFGHDNVCVLNGGLPAWLSEGYNLNTEYPKAPTPTKFQASFRNELVIDLDGLQQAIQEERSVILDARTADRFRGAAPEPRENLRSGHMPHSSNVPHSTLITPDTGKLKPSSELRSIFDQAGYKEGESTITTCGSGITACFLALGLFICGNQTARIYDGSWCEYGDKDCQSEVMIS